MGVWKKSAWVIALLALLPAARAAAEERTNWRHDKGSFEKTADGTWVEKAGDGTYQFEEKDRTDQYVELHDKGRNITVRLEAGYCLVKVGDKGRFKRTYKGAWVAAETRPEAKTKPDAKARTPEAKVPVPPGKADTAFTEVATFPGHGNLNLYNFGVAVSPDGRQIALTMGNALKPEFGILDVDSGKVTRRWEVPTLVSPLIWSDDGSSLAGILLGEPTPDGRKSQVVVWDTSTWEQRAAFDHPGFPGALALSRDGNVVAAASGSSGTPGVLNIWGVPARKQIFTLEVNTSSPRIALTANGKSAAMDGLGPKNDQIVLFDLPSGKPRRTVQGLGPFVLSPDGNNLLLWSFGTNVLQFTVWDLRGVPQPGRAIKGEKWKPDSIALLDDGRYVVLGGGVTQDEVRVYELRTGKLAYTFPTTKNPGRGRRMLIVRPVPDSSRLLTYGTDGVVRLWTTPFGDKREAPDSKPDKDR
jgi:WD40 repeat protein